MEKPFTNPLALEWLVKADADYVTANRELRARKMPNYDAACFHAQQCVEKLLKLNPPSRYAVRRDLR
jgi:HEPN domain-containing protein